MPPIPKKRSGTDPKPSPKIPPLDILVDVNGDKGTLELDIRNNARVRVGDRYIFKWDDGAITVLRVESFKSAEEYSNTAARRTEAMREGITGPPQTPTARKAYQTKLAVLRIEGELLPDGTRKRGAYRVPDVMVPLQPMPVALLERFVTYKDGNLTLGNLRSGRRVLDRPAPIRHNYGGDRMVILGRPGMGKSQLTRSLLSQAMADE